MGVEHEDVLAEALAETLTYRGVPIVPVTSIGMDVSLLVDAIHEDYIPTYATPGAACMDLRSAEEVTLSPGSTALVSVGFRCVVPQGYEMQIRPRSGLSKQGIVIPNSPGTVDSDYRGDVKAILKNTTSETFVIRKGDRIAQCSLHRTVPVRVVRGEVREDTARGAGGFGSTGR